MHELSEPAVSIILPTYNRARFMAEAMASIQAQHWLDWELIVVDDGSGDETRSLVPVLTENWKQPVKYIYQHNQGPAIARNRGIDEARGKLIAFFDSDDLWLPHHLTDCVNSLEANPDVDWVFTASRVIDEATGNTLTSNSFYPNGQALPFLELQIEARGTLRVLSDPRVAVVALTEALNAGLQSSLIRSRVFQNLRLPQFRVGEDQTFSVVAIKSGFRLAFIDDVHLIYRTHAGSISAGPGVSQLKRAAASRELARAYESLVGRLPFTAPELVALKERIGREYFWNAGYQFQSQGQYREARACYRRGLMANPLQWQYWKTYALSYVNQLGQTLCHRPSASIASR